MAGGTRLLQFRVTADNFGNLEGAHLLEFFDSVEFISNYQPGSKNTPASIIAKLKHQHPLHEYEEIDALRIITILTEGENESIAIVTLGGPFTRKVASLDGLWFTYPTIATPDFLKVTISGIPSSIKEIMRMAQAFPERMSYSLLESDDSKITSVNMSDMPPKRQKILLKAIELGYYRYPRGCTQRDIAEAVGLKQATVSEHLQKGESTVLNSWSKKHN